MAGQYRFLQKMTHQVWQQRYFYLVLPVLIRSRRTTDSMRVSEALDLGSIPSVTTKKSLSALLRGFLFFVWQIVGQSQRLFRSNSTNTFGLTAVSFRWRSSRFWSRSYTRAFCKLACRIFLVSFRLSRL